MLTKIVPGKAKQFDISWACEEFYEICKIWNLYNEDLHSINVIYRQKYSTPSLLFPPFPVVLTLTIFI